MTAFAADAHPNVHADTINDINTTPLIDVMLVLLIMLIITIPIQTHKVPIDLPIATPSTPPPNPDRNKLAIDADGALFFNGARISEAQLTGALDRIAAMPVQPELQLQPHPEARYDVVDRVLAAIKRANITNLGIVGNENYARF